MSAIQAHKAALASEMIWQWSQWLRQGHIDDRLPKRPEAEEWIWFYRDHGRVFRGAWDAFPQGNCSAAMVQASVLEIQQTGRLARNNPEEFKRVASRQLAIVPKRRVNAYFRLGLRAAMRGYHEHLDEVATILVGQDGDEELEGFEAALKGSPEFYFLVRVVLPCLIEHRMLPIDLLRLARRGDERAIEKLLRLDDLAIHEPRIVAWINGAGGGQRRARLQDATKWAREGPIGQNHPQHFKQAMGGLILALSRRTFFILDKGRLKPQPLKATQIMHLFDALYRDKHGRREAVMTDPDFAEINPESWTKAISRYRKQWDRVLFRDYPDKKSGR